MRPDWHAVVAVELHCSRAGNRAPIVAHPDAIQWVRYMLMGHIRAYTCMYTYIHTCKYIYIHYTVIYVRMYIYTCIYIHLLHSMLTLGVNVLEDHAAGNNLSQFPDSVLTHKYWDFIDWCRPSPKLC